MIPLFKVGMSPDAIGNVSAVLSSGYIGQGAKVDEFEVALQKELNLTRKPLTMNSCTSALDLAYHLCGVIAGTSVISTPITCMATNTSLIHRGAKIMWADVNPVTGLIDPESVKKIVGETRANVMWPLKAIVAVDWGGAFCDYKELKKHGIPVIQDAAHSYLGMVDGHHLGEIHGDYAVWSFQAIKHLTCGDGGALLNPQNQRAELLRWYGLDRKTSADFRCQQTVNEIGYKYHMNDISAAIGLANMSMARDCVRKNRENALYYSNKLRATDASERVTTQPWDDGSSWWLYTIIVENQEDFIEHMAKSDIEASPVHARNDKHPQLNFGAPELPGVAEFSSHEVCIPVGWWLSRDDRDKVVDGVLSWT